MDQSIVSLIEAEDFMARCSGVGDIMADIPKGKRLPQGAKTFVEDWFIEQVTGQRKFNGNKYTKKGWEVEDAAIDEYGKFTGYTGLVKNEEFFANSFTQGTPDVFVGDDLVTDIKAPWSLRTFSKYRDCKMSDKYPAPNRTYYYQLQAYMAITGRERAELAYVLMNTPKHLLERDTDIKEWDDYEKKMTLKERVKIFTIPKSYEHICRIEERVELCRDYLREIIIPANS